MPDAAPKRLVRRRSHGSTEVLTVRAADGFARSHRGAAWPVFAAVEDALRGFQCL